MLDAVLSSGSSHLIAGALARRCGIAQSMMKTDLDCLPGILMGA
jgi:hypothetical protein